MNIEPVTLTGYGVVLRPPAASDADVALGMLLEAEVARWMPADVHDLGSALDWIRRSADWTGHATFVVADPLDDRMIGNVTLFGIDAEQQHAEVGYRVALAARGRGVATAALTAVTTWAFEVLRLRRVQLEHAVPNVASCTVAAMAGYRLEAKPRSAYVAGDGLRYDTHLHGRLRVDSTSPLA